MTPRRAVAAVLEEDSRDIKHRLLHTGGGAQATSAALVKGRFCSVQCMWRRKGERSVAVQSTGHDLLHYGRTSSPWDRSPAQGSTAYDARVALPRCVADLQTDTQGGPKP